MLVYDSAGQDAIPKSMQLVAGRTGQEYNKRKKCKGAFWKDRYHATIIEDGKHLLRCIVYLEAKKGDIDPNNKWIWNLNAGITV